MRKKKEELSLTWATAPEVLTVEEVAALARIPRNAAYEAIRLGLIPSVNFGTRRIRISKAELAKILGRKVESPLTAAFGPEA